MAFRDDGCDGTAPYHGTGARAGLDLDIREIENGYIVTPSRKYCDNVEDEESPESYCGTKEELQVFLETFLKDQISSLLEQIETSTEFVDEIDEQIVKDVKVKVKRQGTAKGDVSALLAKMAAAKKKAEAGQEA